LHLELIDLNQLKNRTFYFNQSIATQGALMYKRILIATDGSELSDKAVESGLSLAALTGATVIALKVVPRYPRSYFEGGLPVDASDIRRIEKQWSDAAQAMVDAIKDKGETQGLTVKAIVAKSDLVAEAVIAAAKKHKCDLIVMASHGRKGIKRLLLGSETQHVLTHSHIPVLVLR
jgi:nucleotide-binding universal stress UspA family protein